MVIAPNAVQLGNPRSLGDAQSRACLPHPGGGLNLGYTLRYRNYGRVDDLPSNLSHYFLAQGAYDFRSGFALGFKQDYRDGVLDAQDFDPGGEVVYRSGGAFDTLEMRKAIVGWLGRYYHSVQGGD